MNQLVNIEISKLYPHPENPRKDVGDVSELAESIKKKGVMQNLTIIPGHFTGTEWVDDEYTLLIGHRRCAAAKLAGLKELPCKIVEGLSQKEQITIMLEENMQRSDLTVYEQAQSFQLMLDLGETESSIAEKTGFSKTTIRHRLNLAKLDQNELKEKSQDESFQLSITDLYSLERVKNIETRNKILKEATNSSDLICRAERAALYEEKEEKKAKIIPILERQGVTKAPEKVGREIYDGKWNNVESFSLDNEIPTKIEIKNDDKEVLYYLVYWNEIRVVKKNKKVKKEKVLTPEEIKRREIQKNSKWIKERMKEIEETRKLFIQNILSGKIPSVKDEDGIRERIWRLIAEEGLCFYPSYLLNFFTGKDYYVCSDEERQYAIQEIKKLSFTNSMLVALHVAMAHSGEVYTYQGKYDAENGKKIVEAYKILKLYGWTFERSEDECLIDGTHEIYIKEDES